MRYDGPRIIWEPGDRVIRMLYMDNGEWQASDDRCLAGSPLMHGTVLRVEGDENEILEAVVEWDEDTPLRNRTRRYYEHGIDPEPDTGTGGDSDGGGV